LGPLESARARAFGAFIFMAIFAAVFVFVLLNPSMVLQQQLEKPEGWNVIWLGPHVAIELFGSDGIVSVSCPYCH
jgi:hypothetical protein